MPLLPRIAAALAAKRPPGKSSSVEAQAGEPTTAPGARPALHVLPPQADEALALLVPVLAELAGYLKSFLRGALDVAPTLTPDGLDVDARFRVTDPELVSTRTGDDRHGPRVDSPVAITATAVTALLVPADAVALVFNATADTRYGEDAALTRYKLHRTPGGDSVVPCAGLPYVYLIGDAAAATVDFCFVRNSGRNARRA